MGKSWPHKNSNSYRYLFAWGLIHASCVSYISNSLSGIGQNLNWNVTHTLEKPYTSALSYMDSWCVVPFSSNISWTVWGQSKWVSVLAWQRNCSCLSPHDKIPCRREGGNELGTQQDNSNMKQAVTNIIPVRGMRCRVKEASHCNVYGWTDILSEGSEWCQLLIVKKRIGLGDYTVAKNLLFMRCSCT
jgi:hypothetical protein